MGAIVFLKLPQGMRAFEITEIKDGRVVFKKPGVRFGGRWHLPLDYVRQAGQTQK